MSDRLTDLRRQRVAIQQHLEWLDREIATAQTGASSQLQPAPAAIQPAPVAAPSASVVTAPEAILPDMGQPDPANAARQAKTGCLLYLAVALVVLCATIFIIFHLADGDRPWLFMDRGEAAASTHP